MWLMVFFDLPVKTKPQRARASRFRQFLKKDGYIMLQLSVYARVCRGQDAVDKHIRRVRTSLPKEGSVRRGLSSNGTENLHKAARLEAPRPSGMVESGGFLSVRFAETNHDSCRQIDLRENCVDR